MRLLAEKADPRLRKEITDNLRRPDDADLQAIFDAIDRAGYQIVPIKPPVLDHIHANIERWPHFHFPEGLHAHNDPQDILRQDQEEQAHEVRGHDQAGG